MHPAMKVLHCSQEELCLAISTMDPSISREDFEGVLEGKIVMSNSSKSRNINDMDENDSSGVLPICVACSLANMTALLYLVSLGRTEITGSPLQRAGSGSCAVHHAGSAGLLDAIKLFSSMGYTVKDQMKIANTNGDNPLMMAAVSGHLGFLKGIFELAQGLEGMTKEEAKTIFETKNKDGNSCITFSCNHGHGQAVEWLIFEVGVEFTDDEFDRCKNFVHQTERALTSDRVKRHDPEKLESYKIKHERVKFAYSLLEKWKEKRAGEAAAALLSLEGKLHQSTKAKSDIQKKVNSKKKKKKNHQKSKGVGNTKVAAFNANSNPNLHRSDTVEKKNDEEERVQFKTLDDGRHAVAINGDTYAAHPTNSPVAVPLTLPKASVEEMFRERVKGSVPSSDEQIDEVMNALCLDVSMLLYTTHSFALNLSPSQLSTVEQILEKQLKAIKEAREIQTRMHGTM
jgi:hypothetical protein